MNVLLVDDDDIFNFLNKGLIERSGLSNSVLIFKSALKAIQHFETNGTQNAATLIFLDIKMPEMNGHEFLKAFSLLCETLTRNVRIVMLSSTLLPEDIAQARQYPAVIDFVEKPMNAEKLTALISKFSFPVLSAE